MVVQDNSDPIEGARRRWRQAASFNELCNLSAEFIQGKLPYFPGYGAETVDAETGPLVPYLVALNKSGFLTEVSQPGCLEGAFQQRAFVQGFAQKKTALRIARISLYSDLHIAVFRPGTNAGSMTPVTVEDFRPYTWAGFTNFEGVRQFEQDCGESAVRELKEAWYVTAIDLVWGRESQLWSLLANELCYSVSPHPDLGHDYDIFTF